jgi:hypothetical protein
LSSAADVIEKCCSGECSEEVILLKCHKEEEVEDITQIQKMCFINVNDLGCTEHTKIVVYNFYF